MGIVRKNTYGSATRSKTRGGYGGETTRGWAENTHAEQRVAAIGGLAALCAVARSNRRKRSLNTRCQTLAGRLSMPSFPEWRVSPSALLRVDRRPHRAVSVVQRSTAAA